MKIVEDVIKEHDFILAGWRDVPTNKEICGEDALKTLPHISQAFINPTKKIKKRDRCVCAVVLCAAVLCTLCTVVVCTGVQCTVAASVVSPLLCRLVP